MVYLQEITYTLRSLRRAAAFPFISVGILALGIAGTTLVFSVINAAMLRPLPYPRPAQLVIFNWYSSGQFSSRDMPASTFLLLRDQVQSFQSLAAIHGKGVNLSGSGGPRYAAGLFVSSSFFRTLDVAPQIGRVFTPEEDHPGGLHLAVISDGLWSQRFNRDPSALGRELHVNGEPYTVLGVMPSGFRSYPEADLWMPLQLTTGTAEPGYEYLAIGRLRNDKTIEDAQRELDQFPEYRSTIASHPGASQLRLVVNHLHSFTFARIQDSLWLLFGAVLLVLLITCTNLAVLFTVHAAGRIREVAIRLALGATRVSLIRIFLMEGLILAVIGGTVGAILAKEALPFVLRLAPADSWSIHSVTLDARVLLFTTFISILTAVLFGLAPAFGMSHANLTELLRQTTSNVTSGLGQARFGRILASAQAALTIVLLTGAGSLLYSFAQLQSVSPGFNPRHLWALQLSLASERYRTSSASAQFLEQLCEKIDRQPGIESAATVTGLPTELGVNLFLKQADSTQKITYSQYRIVSSGYFQAMGSSIVAGRPFAFSDSRQAAHVAIINETLAKQWWPNQTSLGHYVMTAPGMTGVFADSPRQVIGVVNDIHELGLAVPPPPTIFVPLEQVSDGLNELANRYFPVSIVVRTQNGSSPVDSIHNLLETADPDLPIASSRLLSEILSGSLARQRFYSSLITGFGVFAVVLTAIGLYGLVSYQIMLRTREIAVRMALGAPRSQVAIRAVKQGTAIVLLGALLGALAVPLEMKALGAMLYNVRGATPYILVGVTCTLLAVAALTSLVSAARAASIEPATILGVE